MVAVALKTEHDITQALEKRKKWYAMRGKVFRLAKPPLLHPDQIAREYLRDLWKRFSKLYDFVDRLLIERLPSLLRDAAFDIEPIRRDALPEDLQVIINGILVEFGRELTEDEIQSLAKRRAREVSQHNLEQNDKVFRQVLGVDVFRNETYLPAIFDLFADQNARLISTLTDRHITDVQSIVMEGFRDGLSVQEIENRIRSRVGKTNANLKLIARDQIAKLNGQLTRVRQQAVGITRYEWSTSKDERVRPSHRVKEGKIFNWDDPPPDTGHPGNDYQCRCAALPVLEDLIE